MKAVPLEDILASLESGARPPGGASADSGEIPSLGGEHLSGDGGFDLKAVKRIPRPFFESMRGGRIAARDILVVKDGATTGKTSFVGEGFPFHEAAVNEHVFCVRVDQSKARPEYVYHFLRSPVGQRAIALDFRGATVGGISRDFAKKTRLPLPCLPEQRRIAEVLDMADALRAKRRAALAQLDILIQSVFVDMFDRRVAEQHGWPLVCLGDLCEDVIDCPHATPTYSDVTTPYACVRSSDIQKSRLSFLNTKYVERSEYETRIARGAPRIGDVIYCREGARFGNAARVDTETLLCLGQRMMLFRPKEKVSTTEYLWAFLSSPGAYGQASRLVGGSASPHVNIKEIVAFRVHRPPIPLQCEFSRRMEWIDRQFKSMSGSLDRLSYLFTALQNCAFRSGM